MTEKPSFRLYRPGDFPALVTMVTALYREDPPGEAMNAAKVMRTVTMLSRAPERGRIVIFDINNEVAGYAIVIHCWSNEFSGDIHLLDEMYIMPHKRNLGIGTAFCSIFLARSTNPSKDYWWKSLPITTVLSASMNPWDLLQPPTGICLYPYPCIDVTPSSA